MAELTEQLTRAQGDFEQAKRNADAYLVQRQQGAQAILAEKTAHAEKYQKNQRLHYVSEARLREELEAVGGPARVSMPGPQQNESRLKPAPKPALNPRAGFRALITAARSHTR